MKRFGVLSLAFCLVFLSFSVAFADLDRDDSFLAIDGSPLRIEVGSEGSLAAYVDGTQQYYSEDAWGSVLFLDFGAEGQQQFFTPYHSSYAVSGDAFVAVSNDQVSSYQVETTLDAGTSEVQVVQTVTYVDGERYYKKTWEISNDSVTTFTNLRFFHGGDTYFGDDDSSEGHYNSAIGMVYLTNPDPSIDGIMGFYANPLTPAAHYYEGNYSDGNNYIADGELPDTVDSTFVDAGYALQWNRDSLAPGETWTIEAYEKWTEAGFVQVLAAADGTGAASEDVEFKFVVQNLDDEAVSFDLTAVSSNGWAVTVDPAMLALEAFSSDLATVTLSIPGDAAAGTTDSVTLTAVSQVDEEVSNSDSLSATVGDGSTGDEGTSGGGGNCGVAGFAPSVLLLMVPLAVMLKK